MSLRISRSPETMARDRATGCMLRVTSKRVAPTTSPVSSAVSRISKLKGDKVALGAQAIALGLIGDRSPETTDLLIKILSDRGLDKKLRGSAAIAIGLLGDNKGKPAILKALEEREDRDLILAADRPPSTQIGARRCRFEQVRGDPRACPYGVVLLLHGSRGGPAGGLLCRRRDHGAHDDARKLVAELRGDDAVDVRDVLRPDVERACITRDAHVASRVRLCPESRYRDGHHTAGFDDE